MMENINSDLREFLYFVRDQEIKAAESVIIPLDKASDLVSHIASIIQEITTLKARIKELEQEREWRLIEDPKMTFEVLVTDGVNVSVAEFVSNADYDEEGNDIPGWLIDSEMVDTPTHWMPSPKPPESEVK